MSRLIRSLLLWQVAVFPAQAQDDQAERERCAAVRPFETVQFQGRTLVEIPDVTDPRLRLANVLVSSRCYDAAIKMLENYVAEEGRNAQALYIAARYVWIHSGNQEAEKFIDALLAEYPSFVSAKVLLSGVLVDQRRFAEAVQLLTELERDAPTDLWVVLNGLRVAAQLAPDPMATEALLAILANAQFPPNAREGAGQALWRARARTIEQAEQGYRDLLSFESATPLGCKVENLGWWLIERQGRLEDARKALEPYADGQGSCYPNVRRYLAYTYFVASAQIAPGITPANTALVQRAFRVLGGDYRELDTWLSGKPHEASVRRLMAAAR